MPKFDTTPLLSRIASRLQEQGMTERAASMAATGKPDMIRQMRARNTKPGADKINNLARVLQVSVEWLMNGDGSADVASVDGPGTRLRNARFDAGFPSAGDAARRFGWLEAGYRHHENGTRGFGAAQASLYGDAFSVSPAWLLGLNNGRRTIAQLSWPGEAVPDEIIVNGVRFVPEGSGR